MPSLLPFKFLFQKNLLFSEFNFSAVCVDKNEFVQVRILTLGADLHYIALCIWWGFRICCTGIKSDILGALEKNMFRTWSFPSVYSYTVSMACDSVLLPKTALQNCVMYSFIIKEAKLWLQPYLRVWCSLLFSFISQRGLRPFLNTNSGSYLTDFFSSASHLHMFK